MTEWTALRSFLLALAAWPVCVWLERGLRGSARRTLFAWLLASPFLFPELLLGYLIAPFVVGRPLRAEIAVSAVLLLRSVPVGVIALWGTPPSDISPAALHVRRLKLRTWRDRWELIRCYWHGPVRRMLPALGLMFLITFQEFEAAALLGAVSWTDQLFTQYAAGLMLAESGRYLVKPLLVQLAVLSLVAWNLGTRPHGTLESNLDRERPVRPIQQRLAESAAIAFFLLGVVGPLVLLSRELAGGWTLLVRQPSMRADLAREICTAGLVAVVSGLAAWMASKLGVERSAFSVRQSPSTPHSALRILHFALSLLGLCGALTVSLAVLWVSTRWFPSAWAMTPLAWVLALVVWLLPRALLLQFWLARQSDPAATHLVALLKASPQPRQARTARGWDWRWRVEPQIAAVGLLCYWAYLDLTSAALLAPPGMASVLVRLYNFMHFGHSAAMTTQAALVMLGPILLWAAMMATARAMRG